MVIFPLAPDQTIAQMWLSGARGAQPSVFTQKVKVNGEIPTANIQLSHVTAEHLPQGEELFLQ